MHQLKNHLAEITATHCTLLYHSLKMRNLNLTDTLFYLKRLEKNGLSEQETAEILDTTFQLQDSLKNVDELDQIVKIKTYTEYRLLRKLLEAIPPL